MRENLYRELEQRGYVLRLLHPRQTHQFHEQQGLRAKTDRLDAMTIERRVVERGGTCRLCPQRTSGHLSGTGTFAYAFGRRGGSVSKRDPGSGCSALPRVHPGLCRSLRTDCSRSPQSFSKVAQAVAEAGIEPLFQLFRAQKPAHYGRPTAQKLVAFARQSASSGRALTGRSVSLRILCDQLEHTRANLARLDAEIESLLANDPGVKGLAPGARVWPQDGGGAPR